MNFNDRKYLVAQTITQVKEWLYNAIKTRKAPSYAPNREAEIKRKLVVWLESICAAGGVKASHRMNHSYKIYNINKCLLTKKRLFCFFFLLHHIHMYNNLVYCITQHLHFGFFFMTTCSTWDASPAGTTVPLCTSTAPGEPALSFFTLPFALWGVAFSCVAFLGDSVIGWCAVLLAYVILLSVWSIKGVGDGALPDVGVIGLPPFINSTISSASRLKSPPGRNGLSQPLSVLKTKIMKVNQFIYSFQF